MEKCLIKKTFIIINYYTEEEEEKNVDKKLTIYDNSRLL